MLAVLPPDRRASAFRRFPPGCGRHRNAAAGLPPRHPLRTAAAAATKTKPPLLNASSVRTVNKTAAPPPRRTLCAASYSRTQGPGRGVGDGKKATATAAVTARRVSAMRRYPPGCGRGVAAPMPPASLGKGQGGGGGGGGAGAGKPNAVVYNGNAMARPCDREVVLRAPGLDHAEFNSNGGVQSEGDGDADVQEEGGGKPWVVTGLMAVPFLPWAQHGRRSQWLNA